jgi:hypothetical protein
VDSRSSRIEPNHAGDKETFSTALHGVAPEYTLLHNLGKAQKDDGYEWTDDGEWWVQTSQGICVTHCHTRKSSIWRDAPVDSANVNLFVTEKFGVAGHVIA